MKRRRRSAAALPSSPLEFAYPLSIPAPEGQGAVILFELPDTCAATVLRIFRLLIAWIQGPELSAEVLHPAELRRFEEEILHSDLDREITAPLATIIGELIEPNKADVAMISWSCLVLNEWLLEIGAEETHLLFGEAAALAWPNHARYAWIAGKLFRRSGKLRQAEAWLKRALRVAVWNLDTETQNLALNSLGNLYAQEGRYQEGLRYLTRAHRHAVRERLSEREAAVVHDLFLLYSWLGEHSKAETLAAQALVLYGSDHEMLPKLAHDVAHLWNNQGKFSLALPVLRHLEPHFSAPEDRLRVLASEARAAGACLDHELFDHAFEEAFQIVQEGGRNVEPVLPTTLVELGWGAASIGEWTRARTALQLGLDAASKHSEHDSAVQAELALEMVARHERIEQIRLVSSASTSSKTSADFVRTLHKRTLAVNLVEH
jgi:tetratricopeptide (TPR) repeat protein